MGLETELGSSGRSASALEFLSMAGNVLTYFRAFVYLRVTY